MTFPSCSPLCDRILVMQSGHTTEEVARMAVDEQSLAARLAG